MRRLLDYCSISKNVVSKFEGKKKYVATGDIIENEIKSFEKVTFDNRPSRAKQIGKNGDVIFAKMKDTVKVLKISDENEENIYSTGFFVLSPTEKINSNYLFWLLNSKKFNYEKDKRCHGATQKALNNEDLGKILIKDIPDIEQQINISDILEKTDNIIKDRKKQINELHELVKSQFVEIFGNPIINDKNIDFMEMPAVCEIIDGDRGKNYPKAEEFFEEGYCLFLNAKNVTSNGFSFENCMYITEEKDKKLRNGKLKRGDVVLTTRGTVGNLAFYTEEIPFENVRINSGMVILRMKKDIVNEIFFIEQFKMQLDNIKNKISNGSAQPQLPIAKMNGIKVLLPDIRVQNKFAEIVKQIDKQKFEIKKSLTEMENLYNSLMNEYFG